MGPGVAADLSYLIPACWWDLFEPIRCVDLPCRIHGTSVLIKHRIYENTWKYKCTIIFAVAFIMRGNKVYMKLYAKNTQNKSVFGTGFSRVSQNKKRSKNIW